MPLLRLLLALLLCVSARAAGIPELKYSVYLTADSVRDFFAKLDEGAKPVEALRRLGVSRVCLEVYRGGTLVDVSEIERVRDYFKADGFGVFGGIATLPGGDFGVKETAPLGWMNWQNEKSRRDLEGIVRAVAGIFDDLIIDDFFCTGDTSAESVAAKGDRSWADYRCELLTNVGRSVFIGPAKEVNPDVRLIIKYPQWYDRFQEFGYDVSAQSAQFDLTWVGTETRGSRTRRFGFVQPYEGFVNYRYIASIAGADKMAGAWFDHGDCDANDFVEQAFQTVLAGAPEIMLFSYHAIMDGHPGHELLVAEREHLAALSKAVRVNPVRGVPAYKPPNSDAHGDLYLMDVLGMLGIPLVPVSTFPDSKVIFLPAQAATDPAIAGKVAKSVAQGRTIIMTSSFLATAGGGEQLAALAGVAWPVASKPFIAPEVAVEESGEAIPDGLHLEADLQLTDATPFLSARFEGRNVPVLTYNLSGNAEVYVLNTHTYSQADFEEVGEVLLAPKPLGLLHLPALSAFRIRHAFTAPLGFEVYGPTRVAVQPFGEDWMVHNYNEGAAAVKLKPDGPSRSGRLFDAETGFPIEVKPDGIELELAGRSRIWIQYRTP